MEWLERRTLLSFPPAPIIPDKGEFNLLEQAKKFEDLLKLNALDNFPIPFTVVASHAGGAPVIVKNNPHSGAPMRVEIDVDSNPLTGKGGKDVAVQVSTELFEGGAFNPHLLTTIDRLGTAPFAEDFEVLVSFPFAAFNSEPGVGNPNLFIGYKTTGEDGPDDPGGIAPLREEIRFIPNLQAGAEHQVEIELNTTGASNPLQFLTGFFGGTNLTGIQDAAAYAAWVEDVPDNITIGLGVGNSDISLGAIDGSFNLSWDASSTSKVVFDYLEEESGDLSDSDFNTRVTFDEMPTQEDLSINIDEAAETLTLSHRANAQIDAIEILSERNDGLKIVGTLTDVPTEVDLTLGLAGSAVLDVNANTLDMKLEAMKEGGFLSTADFLGYNLGYVAVSMTDAPDLTIDFDPSDDSVGVKATNAGESIRAIELVIDDDGHYGAIIDGEVDYNNDGVIDSLDVGDVAGFALIDGRLDIDKDGDVDGDDDGSAAGMAVINGLIDVNASSSITAADDLEEFLVGLATPPSYFEGLDGLPGELHHLFSLVDHGDRGTAVARLLYVEEATLDLNPSDFSEAFTLKLTEPAPFQAYLRTTDGSNIIPDHDIEVTIDIDDMPMGQTQFDITPPFSFGYTTNPPQGIESIHIFGHIDNTYFDIIAGDLPAVFDFAFDPDGSLSILADDGDGVPEPASPGDQVGLLGGVFSNAIDPDGLSGAAKELFGAPVRDAAFRVDDIPSFDATWLDNATQTAIDFDTVENDAFLGGVQIEVRTDFDELDPLNHDDLLEASLTANHYLRFNDEGAGERKRLAAGAFGIDTFSYASDDDAGTMEVAYDANSAHVLIASFDSTFGGRFFPDKDINITLNVNAVPQAFSFVSDLATQFAYEASSAIAAISMAGTVDETDDDTNNGVNVTFGLLGLPDELRIGIIPGEILVIDGRLDVSGNGAFGSDDDGFVAGVQVFDGQLDLNGNGTLDAGDAGTFFGVSVVPNGRLDIDASGTADNADDGGLAGAEVFASNSINQVGFKLESIDNAVGIFGEVFRVIQVLADEIPARMVLSYGGDRFLLDTRDEFGNADGLDEISALVSTSKDATANSNKLLPFTLVGPVDSGGPILNDPNVTGVTGPGGSRIQYSHFLQEIDERYYNAEPGTNPSDVLVRLAELYADGERLSGGEDHLIVRMEDLENNGGDDGIGYASFNFNDFQHASWTPDANGGTFIYAAPGRGDDPFFAGMEEDDVYTTLQIDHVPDSIVVDIDKTGHVVYTASASPGDIDLYRGPGNGTDGLFAGEADDAIRAILRDAPSEVRIRWDFSFPNGGAFMDTNSPDGFELLFLTQDGDTRITAGLHLEDLHIGWGIDVLSFDQTKSIEIWNPFGDNLVIPIAWELFQFRAGIDNDADDLLDDMSNVGDPAQVGQSDNVGIAGFFTLYNLDSTPEALNNGGPAASGGEYVPFISVQSEGFKEFFMDFLVELDPTNPDADLFPIDLEFNFNTRNVGNLVFDVWTEETVSFTDDDDIPFIPEVGFENPADYTNNSPIHILPGLLEAPIANGLKGIQVLHDWVITFNGWHAFGDHFDPFDGSPDPFDGSDDTGTGVNPGDVGLLIDAVGPFNGALNRWQTALAASAAYTDEQAANLIADIADHTTLVVGDFAGTILGTATGNSSSATITIDRDAGGFSWFIDTTPFDDAEFPGGAVGQVDMMTFFMHEIGHILGLEHSESGVMQPNLPRGVRRLPVAGDIDSPDAVPNPNPTDDTASLRVDDDEDDTEEEDALDLLLA